MEFLPNLVDRAAPALHAWVAAPGAMPAGVLVIVALIAIWLVGRLLAPFVLILPGVVAGVLIGWWLHTAGWHPPVAIGAGLLLSGVVYQVAAGFYFVRLAAALICAPIALWVVWRLASGTFDGWWALGITIVVAASLGSLLRRFVASEDQTLRARVIDLIDAIRGD